jgi:signal transduction histidine kinase
MTIFSSLTNRIFFASALLAVASIAIAIYNVNVAVTHQAEQELRRGLDEAGTLIEEYRRVLVEHFTREARLIADLPRLKATVDTNDPTTVQPIAENYQRQLNADLLVITGRSGQALAEVASEDAGTMAPSSLSGVDAAVAGHERSSFWPHRGGILQVVSVPIWIDPALPSPSTPSTTSEILGTLSVGFSLDNRAAARFRTLTNSHMAFGVNGAIQASTMPPELWPSLATLLARDGVWDNVPLGDQSYIAVTRTLPAITLSGTRPGQSSGDNTQAKAIILRSRTERLGFLNPLHGRLGIIAIVAVLAATLLSYAIARTVTRPLGTITATMREMAATGDLTRKIPAPPGGRWEDEDARLLASTFNTMTDSIARFQREASQRERLSSLGRMSSAVAHEIRNPLMIIRAALRTLRSPQLQPEEAHAAVADIDEETARLNRLVTEVLDSARPIKFDRAPADLNALCEDAARAASSEADAVPIRLSLDRTLPRVITDAERLRRVLVNILTNARNAVAARDGDLQPGDPITLSTHTQPPDRIAIDVRDRGTGIAAGDLPRVFDPFFTTRRTGTGLGLAISRNIIEGLGGTIAVSSHGEGTDVHIELPVGTAVRSTLAPGTEP